MILDQVIEKVNVKAVKNNPNGIKIFYEGYESCISRFIDDIGIVSVAVFSDEQALSLCQNAVKAIESSGASVYNFVLDKKRVYSMDDLKEAFALNGRVDAVICLGGYAISVAKYYASVNGVPALFILADFRFESIFEDKITININGTEEAITTNSAKYVVFDKELIGKTEPQHVADAYLLLQSKYCTLANYRAHALIKNVKTQPFVCALAEETLTDAAYAETSEEIAECLIKIASAHYLDQNFSLYSDEAAGEIIINRNSDKTGAVRYALALRLFEAYKTLNLKNAADNLAVPFYSERAENLSRIAGVPEEKTIAYFSENRCSETALARLRPLSKSVKTDIDGFISAEEKTYEKFVKMGGSLEDRAEVTPEQLKTALCYCGDYPEFCGLCDILRDVGILESAEKLSVHGIK